MWSALLSWACFLYLGIIKYSCHFSNVHLQFFFFLSNQNELPGFSPLSKMHPSSCSYLTGGTVSFIPMGPLISILMFRLESWEFSISTPLAPTFLVCVYSAFQKSLKSAFFPCPWPLKFRRLSLTVRDFLPPCLPPQFIFFLHSDGMGYHHSLVKKPCTDPQHKQNQESAP